MKMNKSPFWWTDRLKALYIRHSGIRDSGTHDDMALYALCTFLNKLFGDANDSGFDDPEYEASFPWRNSK